MRSLPYFFADIPDPRRAQGRRHRLSTVLAIAAGAVLCGMHGYKAIWDWANSLAAKARERFRRRLENRRFFVPSEYAIRDVLIRVYPIHLDRALQNWNKPMLDKARVAQSTVKQCVTPSMSVIFQIIRAKTGLFFSHSMRPFN